MFIICTLGTREDCEPKYACWILLITNCIHLWRLGTPENYQKHLQGFCAFIQKFASGVKQQTYSKTDFEIRWAEFFPWFWCDWILWPGIVSSDSEFQCLCKLDWSNETAAANDKFKLHFFLVLTTGRILCLCFYTGPILLLTQCLYIKFTVNSIARVFRQGI